MIRRLRNTLQSQGEYRIHCDRIFWDQVYYSLMGTYNALEVESWEAGSNLFLLVEVATFSPKPPVIFCFSLI